MDFSLPKVYDAGGNLNARWYVEFFVFNAAGGKKRHKIKGGINKFNSYADRVKAATNLKNELYVKLCQGWRPNNSGCPTVVKPGLTFMQFFNELYDYKKSYVRKNSMVGLKYHRQLIFTYFGNADLLLKHPQEINSAHFIAFMQHLHKKGLCNRTRNNVLLSVKSLYAVCNAVFPDVAIVNPVASIKPIPYVNNKNLPYSDALFIKLINYIAENDPLLHRFCRCFVYLGIRPHEACYIQLADIDFVDKTVTIKGANNKTNLTVKKQIFEIHFKDFEPYQNWPPNYYLFSAGINQPGATPTTRDYFSKRFLKAKKALNLPKSNTMYAMRHTFLINLYKNGVPLKDIMKITGHKTLNALQVYIQSYLNEPANDVSRFIKIAI